MVNEDGRQRADVYIEDKIIKQVGVNLDVPGGARIIDATGRMVIPGGIDTHTHCQMPFMGTYAVDDFYIGTKVCNYILMSRSLTLTSHLGPQAALAGGTTMIIDFVIPTSSSREPLLEAYNRWRGWADPKVCCDYAFHMAITYWDESVPAQMERVTGEGVSINSFKVFMAYKDVMMLDDHEIIECFKVKTNIHIYDNW